MRPDPLPLKPVGLMADIESMFHQVNVCHEARIAELFASYGGQKMILTPNPKNFKCWSTYLELPPPRAVQILHCAKQQMIKQANLTTQ